MMIDDTFSEGLTEIRETYSDKNPEQFSHAIQTWVNENGDHVDPDFYNPYVRSILLDTERPPRELLDKAQMPMSNLSYSHLEAVAGFASDRL